MIGQEHLPERHLPLPLRKLAEILAFEKPFSASDLFAAKLSKKARQARGILITVALENNIVRDDGVLQDAFGISRNEILGAIKETKSKARWQAQHAWDTYREKEELKRMRRIPRAEHVLEVILDHFRTDKEKLRMFSEYDYERHPRQMLVLILHDIFAETARRISDRYLHCGELEVHGLRRAGINDLILGVRDGDTKRAHEAAKFFLDMKKVLAKLDALWPEVWNHRIKAPGSAGGGKGKSEKNSPANPSRH
ncbi:hypothetical protein FJY93_01290 [Candidatus Kaiserbacteria bacterium]|nr:hypothetical protein [Candidatus Kaiserbacteria bacterium]